MACRSGVVKLKKRSRASPPRSAGSRFFGLQKRGCETEKTKPVLSAKINKKAPLTQGSQTVTALRYKNGFCNAEEIKLHPAAPAVTHSPLANFSQQRKRAPRFSRRSFSLNPPFGGLARPAKAGAKSWFAELILYRQKNKAPPGAAPQCGPPRRVPILGLAEPIS